MPAVNVGLGRPHHRPGGAYEVWEARREAGGFVGELFSALFAFEVCLDLRDGQLDDAHGQIFPSSQRVTAYAAAPAKPARK